MQIKRGYAEGGFLDDGAVVDAVSGNEVPTGSLEEEVRDDIPAQLSEGEFVLPADVVRFIGLDKLMKMRKAAKMGLANMEDEGQIGGSPAPAMHVEMESMGMDDESMEMDALIDGMDDDDFDGAAQNFAKGGSVRGYKAGGAADLPSYADYTGRGGEFGSVDVVEYAKYTNKAGDIISLPTYRGKLLRAIPEGFYPVGSPPDDVEVPDPVVDTGSGGGGRTIHKNDADNPWRGITAPGDSDAIKNHHQIRSDKVTTTRRNNLKDLVDSTVDNEDQVTMYNMLSEDAKELFSKRFHNPEGLDALFTKNKTPAELMYLAQTTADSIRRNKKLPDPGYDGKPSGNTFGGSDSESFIGDFLKGLIPDMEDVKNFFIGAALGGLGIPLSAVKLYDKLASDEQKKDLKKAENKFVQSSNVPSNPFTDTTEVETPTNDTVTPPVDLTSVESSSPGATTTPVTPTAVVTPSTNEGPRGGYGTTPVTTSTTPMPTAQDVNSQDAKLLSEMGVGATPPGALPNATIYDATGNAVSSTPTGEIDITGEDSIPEFKHPDRTAEMGLMGSLENTDEYGNSLSSVGQTGETGQTGVTQDTPDWLGGTPEEAADLQVTNTEEITKVARQLGVDPKTAIDVWEVEGKTGVFNPNTDKQSLQQAITDMINSGTGGPPGRDNMPVVTPVVEASPNERTGQGNNKVVRGKDVTTDANKKAIQDAIDKAKEEDSANPFGYKAKGGLLTKADKPKVKKMRKDNTSGLAAKKKSKERAKAKKGALAAKRT